MTDWQREYRNLVSALWRGYQVYVSAGCTSANFDRHVWPVIAEGRKKLREIANGADLGRVYAVGYKDDLGSYGMVFGPTPDLSKCLEFVPDDDEHVCYVIEFRGGGPNAWDGENRVVARWSSRGSFWIPRATR